MKKRPHLVLLGSSPLPGAMSARSQRTELRREHLRLEHGRGGCVPQGKQADLQEVGAALPASPLTLVKISIP